MAKLQLKAQPRTVTGRKVKQLRAQGMIPAVLYGPNTPSTPLMVREQDAERLLRQAGFTQLVDLIVENGGANRQASVLVAEVQRHPVRRTLQHIDFRAVVMTERLRIEVPVHIVGEAPVVEEGATLVQSLTSVEVECLPADIPESLTVDVSHVTDVDTPITVGDLQAPPGVTIVTPAEEIIASFVYAAAAEAEEEEVEEEMLLGAESAEPEVIRRGKAEEEEEEEE
ncbi:MAG: 50S ribosomal protein L25/general stress protein Ctc [Anaerolineae bacterium]